MKPKLIRIEEIKSTDSLVSKKVRIETPIGNIEDIYGYQQIKYGEKQNDPRQVFKETLGRIAIGDKNEQALRENKNSSEYIHPHFKWQDKFNGWVSYINKKDNPQTKVIRDGKLQRENY